MISCFLTSVITVYLLKCVVTKYLIFLQVICVFKIFVNAGSMTNAKVYQRFHDDKKVEEHCCSWYISIFCFLTCEETLLVTFWLVACEGSVQV